MRSAEEVTREVVQAKTGLAIDRILTEWQAEVAEQVRAETLAGFTEWFSPAYRAFERTITFGHATVLQRFADADALHLASPVDEEPIFVARRLVGPWEPVEP